MNELILSMVLEHNIEITLKSFKHKDRTLFGFDVNTHAKSGLILVENENKEGFTGYGRYEDEYHDLNDLEDIASAVRSCMYGRDFVSDDWLKVMAQYGLVKITKTVSTKVDFL